MPRKNPRPQAKKRRWKLLSVPKKKIQPRKYHYDMETRDDHGALFNLGVAMGVFKI